MREDFDITVFDQAIDTARATLRALDPTIFGGDENIARINATLSNDAPKGTIAVPAGIDVASTHGLMAAIDLTLLDKAAEKSAIEAIAQRAKDEHAATICVYPEHVATVQNITGGNPPPIAVVGFPFVTHPSDTALVETLNQTRVAIADGAKEIDMVLARDFKQGNPDYAAHYRYIRAVVEEAGKHNVPVKVILETAYLTDEQKIEASMLAKMAGATFVKTSTGFANPAYMCNPDGPKGATPHDVALMRRTVGDTTLDDFGRTIPMGVKASGGVRTRDDAIAVYEAGANRIGASGSVDVRSLGEKHLQAQSAARQTRGGQSY